MQGLLDKVKRT